VHASTTIEARPERRSRHDALTRPEFRDPTDVAHEARRRLCASGYLVLQDVSLEVDGELVRLSGQLPCHYLKQVAQACVAEIPGVDRVVNLIKVVAPSPHGGRAASPPLHQEWSR